MGNVWRADRPVRVERIDHLQLAMPAGGEEAAVAVDTGLPGASPMSTSRLTSAGAVGAGSSGTS